MKKHFSTISFLKIIFVCAVFVSGYNAYKTKCRVVISDSMKKNIEALASGEEGTAASRCYLKQETGSGLSVFEYFCNEKTNDEKIYPCPEHPEFGYIDENKKDRCTK